MKRAGFTLIELLVSLTLIALLISILIPSLFAAKDRARVMVCAAQMRGLGSALATYSAQSDRRMPPFAFSSYAGDLPLSGHWGGASQAGDPDTFCRFGVNKINLWALIQEEMVQSGVLICPSAPAEVRDAASGLFALTSQDSSYCLRFPVSLDLFNESPNLANRGNGPLGIYLQAAGGQSVPVGQYFQEVPQVRTDRAYRLVPQLGGKTYQVASDAMLSDLFWRQDYSAPAPAVGNLKSVPVRWAWSHGRRFNVLYGDGGVITASDDGTIAANTNAPGRDLTNDGLYFVTYAERVWGFFDRAR